MSTHTRPRLVPIPGAEGQLIDARIADDVAFLLDQFKVKISGPGGAYATTGHAPGGEHPVGLAVDLVPDFERGGTWDDVDKLARIAARSWKDELHFIGYDGVEGHGRGHHLHLSWDRNNVQSIYDGEKYGVVIPAAAAILAGKVVKGGAKAASKAGGLVDDAGGAAAKGLVGALIAAVGLEGQRGALYVLLLVLGVTFVIVGLARSSGVSRPTSSRPVSAAGGGV